MPKGKFQRKKKPPIDRFMKFVDKSESGCWLWKGYKDKRGYGFFGHDTGVSMLAHRFLFIYENGQPAHGTELDHLCRNPSCVNPDHLEAVSHHENVKRGMVGRHMIQKSKESTHCANGHEFTASSLYLHKGKYKQCRICKNEHQRLRRASQ